MAIPDRGGDSVPPHINLLMQEFLRSQKSVISSLSRLTEHVQDIRGDARVGEKLAISVKEDMAALRGEMNALRREMGGVQGEIRSLRAEMLGRFAEVLDRFQAVGVRFDGQDTILERIERELRDLRGDIAPWRLAS